MMNSDSSRKAKSEPVYIEVGVIILMERGGGQTRVSVLSQRERSSGAGGFELVGVGPISFQYIIGRRDEL